jgi:CRP/FNR family transcriptional regulator, cyclic AMP receptor protein
MCAVIDPLFLSGLPLFHTLSTEHLQQIIAAGRIAYYATGQVVAPQIQQAENVAVIIEGSLKLVSEAQQPRQAVIALLGSGELVGEFAPLNGQGQYVVSIALKPTSLLAFAHHDFEALRQRIPALNHNLVRVLARRLRRANSHIVLLATQDAFGRLAGIVLALADSYGIPMGSSVRISLPLTQVDLAAMAGITRTRANQVFSHFRQSRLLAFEAGNIVVLDREGLARRRL